MARPTAGRGTLCGRSPMMWTVRAPFIVLALLGVGFPLNSARSQPEIRRTAVFSLGRDPSGQKPAAMAGALLRAQVQAASKLRLVEPGRVLSGDPKTREEETLERARAALADGRRAYDALALDDAIARLGQAVSLYQQTGPLLGDMSELQTGLLYLAASLVLRGSADEAESTFLELLTVDPDRQLTDFPPTVRRVFERSATRLDETQSGSVEIYSIPPYAAVHLDGRFEGVTPLVLDEIVAGTHYIRLEKLGYTVQGAPIQIAPKQRIASQTRLRSLKKGAELRDLAARSVSEVTAEGEAMGGQIRELARRLVADTVIFVVVTQSGRDASFIGSVFDAHSGKRIATERTALSSDATTFSERLNRYLGRLVSAAEVGESKAALELPPGAPAFGLGGAPPGPAGAAPEVAFSGAPRRRTPDEVYLGWTLVGLGTASLITGAVFGILAADVHGDFRDTDQLSPDLSDLQDRGRLYSGTADALYIGGGLLVAGGATLVLLADVLNTSPTEQLSVVPTDGGAVVGVKGRF